MFPTAPLTELYTRSTTNPPNLLIYIYIYENTSCTYMGWGDWVGGLKISFDGFYRYCRYLTNAPPREIGNAINPPSSPPPSLS